MQQILLNIRYFERGLSKTLKKSTLFFLINPVLFNVPGYQKEKGPWTSEQSLLKLQNKFRKIISYISSDQVWWCNIKQLLSYFENCVSKLMQANSWHHKLFQFHLSFCIWKVWRGREKITKNRIFWEQKKAF